MTDFTPTRRRFRLTPDRVVIGLLAVECLLWLSERFQWFWFNEKKGWTVLIAVASVGVAMLAMLLWFCIALVFRWRFQFSIRSLLVLTLAVAMPCSWLTTEMRAARRQGEVVAMMIELGGRVEYDWQVDANCDLLANPQPPGRPRLRNLLGDDFFSPVASLDLSSGRRNEGFPESKVTDVSLNNVRRLTRLRWLDLSSTKITNAGLENLKVLAELQVLTMRGTQVTGEGVKPLQHALPNCKIFWFR